MSFLSKLGFTYEPVVEETTPEKAPLKEEATQKKSSLSFSPTITAPTIGGQIIGKFDTSLYEMLSNAIEENNLNGNDFLEFMQSLNKMTGLAVDEKTKFGMVFATLSTSSGGMDKNHLIESIDHYLNVIAKEKTTFQSEMGKATTEMVGKKESEVERLSALAQQKSELIQELSQEIKEIGDNVATLKSDAAQAKMGIAQKEADFAITVQQLEGQINDYKAKIAQHIQ